MLVQKTFHPYKYGQVTELGTDQVVLNTYISEFKVVAVERQVTENQERQVDNQSVY